MVQTKNNIVKAHGGDFKVSTINVNSYVEHF